MRFRIKRFLTGPELGLAAFLGLASARYMWYPYFEEIKEIANEERARQAKSIPEASEKPISAQKNP